MFNFLKNKSIEILAPVNGKVIELSKVEDEVFSQKMLGDGLAIIPSSGDFYAPMNGVLTSVFPTKHAYGIRHKSKVECLLHIGLDTVNLEGKGFESKVNQGDNIKSKDLLVIVDWILIENEIKSKQTPLIFLTETLGKRKIKNIKYGQVKAGEVIAVIS